MKRVVFTIFMLQTFITSSQELSTLKDEQSSPFYIYTESDICSKYIFRGIVLEDNFVFQPAVYGGYSLPGNFGTISTGVWVNFSMPHKDMLIDETSGESEVIDEPFRYNETDIYLIHEFYTGKLLIKNTFAAYLFTKNTGYPNTTEYILNLSYPVNKFNLLSEFACDISAYPGAFVFTHGIETEINLSNEFSLNTSLNLVWAGAKYNEVNSGTPKVLMNSAGTDIALIYSHMNGFYTKLRWQYNRMLDEDIRLYNGIDSWFIGFQAGYAF